MNANKLINAVTYSLLSVFIGITLFSGRMTIFLHPRMIEFITIAFIGLIILGSYSWYEWYKSIGSRTRFKLKWFTIAPYAILILIILSNPTEISAEAKQNRSLSLSQVKDSTLNNEITDDTDSSSSNDGIQNILEDILEDSGRNAEEFTSSDVASDDGDTIERDTEVSETKTGQDLSSSTSDADNKESPQLTQDSDFDADFTLPMDPFTEGVNDFMGIVMGLNENPEQIINQPIVLDGFKFTQDYYDDNTMALGRLLITCCAADASVVGFYIESDEVSLFNADDWVRVEGIIVEDEFYLAPEEQYVTVYKIKDAKLTAIEPYENPYVYYDNY